MFLYCLFIAGTMTGTGHRANDDCAICRAWSKNQALRKFGKMYTGIKSADVSRVRYNYHGIAVLSDY